MKLLATILISSILSLIGTSLLFQPKIWDDDINFGAISYPTSLDSFTNPSGTDSVATVSHSGQHSNANDAIEALESKVGITSSIAVTGSLLAGNGAGSSIWTTYPTSTNFSVTNLATFGSFMSQASSTVIGDLNITGNSTSTNATTTNLFSTNASTTNLFGTNINGFNLSNCSGSDFLQWINGVFNCDTPNVTTNFSANTISSASASYLAQTLSLTENDIVMWWANCQRGAANEQLSTGYKTSNDSSTTTVLQYSGGNGATPSLAGSFTATTTYSFTFQMLAATGCDQGAQLSYFFINN